MKKVICSRQALPFKKYPRYILASSLFLTLLLPISALAAEDLDTSNAEVGISDPFSDIKDKIYINDTEVIEVSNENIQSSKPEISDDKVVIVPTDVITNSDTTTIDDNKSPTSAADAYLYQEKAEKPSEAQLKVADKSPAWMSLEYLLGGGLLLILLGGIFLMLSKINSLKFENRDLAHKNAILKTKFDTQTKLLNNAKEENRDLKSDNIELKIDLENQQNSLVNHDENIIDLPIGWSSDTSQTTVIEDLNESDRNQLADIFDNWLKTNRGNTKVDDLIPEDISKKLKHLHYTIELWGQGNGLDSVESTKNSMHTAVISLIKNDSKGYAYCYKKPNSMSSLWDNKAWYAVEKANGTLKLTGENLEIK